MKYQVIARKTRPQLFEEVVGQKAIIQTLRNAIQMDRIGHAYLFSGPRGVGKTTTARLLAKALNCVTGPTATPCNTCASCREITAAQSMDVIEIDAASNTGVDNIRELRENARYAPSRDRYKIFIIDEVHMLSNAAFNALLKTLEEPPPHVAFIMATTERHKLPATILSRCQQFVFRTISPVETLAHLREVAGRERANVDDRGLLYIVRAAEGSMRDALSLLDQIIAFGGQDIAAEDVREVLGFIPDELLDRTVAALAASDSRAMIETVAMVVDQGLSLQQFVRECANRMRDLLMIKLKLEDQLLEESGREAFAGAVEQFSEQDLVRYFDLLLRLENELRNTSQPRFHLEAGLVKLARIGHIRDIEELIRNLDSGPAPDAAAGDPPRRGAARPAAPAGPARPPARPDDAAGSERPGPRVQERPPQERSTPAPVSRQMPGPSGPASSPPARPPGPAGPQVRKAPAETPPAKPVGETASASPIMEPTHTIQPGLPPGDGRISPKSAENEPLVKRFLEVFRGDIAQVKPAKGE